MKPYPYIISENSVTVVINGKPITTTEGQSNYFAVRDAILDGDWELVEKRLNVAKTIENWSKGDLLVDRGRVFYGEEELHGTVVKKLISLLGQGVKDSSPLVNFITNLLKNPSKSSVDELYDFLDYKQLPIDKDGYVIAYKGVCENYFSQTGNINTKVLQGEVDEKGRIKNEVGKTIEVERRHVDDDRRNNCSHGLHVGSFNYASSFGSKLLLVRFNPADAVSVPQDCSCQKLRVSKYEILEEIENQEEELERDEVYYEPEIYLGDEDLSELDGSASSVSYTQSW